jgi:hypothetical protein
VTATITTGHALTTATRGGSIWVGCICKPGYYVSAVPGQLEAWAGFAHRIDKGAAK